MNLSTNIKLIPVLELQPASFSKIERESPNKSFLEAPQEWMSYNQKSYNDSGLINIQPIKPASWLFEIKSLSDEELKVILRNLIDEAVEDFESINEILNDPIEYAPLIPGGYLFMVDGEIKSEPGCCCGLEDILDWKNSVTVLTGHGDEDFVNINRKDLQVEVSVRDEKFIISEDVYKKTVNDAEVKIDEFIERSGKVINELLGIKTGKSFVKAMIYKWD